MPGPKRDADTVCKRKAGITAFPMQNGDRGGVRTLVGDDRNRQVHERRMYFFGRKPATYADDQHFGQVNGRDHRRKDGLDDFATRLAE